MDSDHVARNRQVWDAQAPEYVADAEKNWATHEPTWGIFGVPESELQMLRPCSEESHSKESPSRELGRAEASLHGKRAVELGCGTAYVSAWLARRGAVVTGIDLSERQLATARRLQVEHRLRFELLQGNCEELPFADQSFDFAISEYGAAIWCRPERWLREAFRVLKPGGSLHFLGCSPWVHVCSPRSGALPLVETLEHPYFDQYRNDWGAEGVEFNLSISGWFRQFHELGWQVRDYLEPRPAAPSPERRHFATYAWGYRYPAEQVWKLRKPG